MQKLDIQQTLLMTGFMFGVWSFVSGLLMGVMGFVTPTSFNSIQDLGPLPGLFITCLLNVLIVLRFVRGTYLSGFRLGLVVFIIVFGVMFFMTQIETIRFNDSIQMPWQIIFSTVTTGMFVGLVTAWLSVRYKQKLGTKKDLAFLPIKSSGLIWKFSLLSIIYTVFYFVFGYYIAWQFPALRKYYSGSTDILPFLVHMAGQIKTDLTLMLFQMVRGFLWTGIAYVVTVSLPTSKLSERMVICGLAVSIGLAAPLLVPNEYMPSAIRLGHFFELLIENFLFGAIAAYLFQPGSE